MVLVRDSVYMCLTCDVEGNPEKWIKELSNLMKLVNKHEIKITFFVAFDEGKTSLPKYERISSMLHSLEEEGHEIGLHIHWGSWKVTNKILEDFNNGIKLCKSRRRSLRSFSQKEINEELEYNLRLMHKLGFSPKSFRGGGLCQTTDCLKVLVKHGFEIDSSIAPGLNEKYGWYQNHIYVPYNRGYYYPSANRYDLSAKNEEKRIGILEVPVTRQRTSNGSWRSVLEPYSVYSFMQIYNWAILQQKIDPKVINYLFHNWQIKRFDFYLLRARARMFFDFNLLRQNIKYALLGNNPLLLHLNFISMLDNILTFLRKKKKFFVTMRELKDKLNSC